MNAGDIDALHALYVDYRRQLFTYALSITGNREAAEDVVHAVFERLLRGGQLPDDLLPYVLRCIRNAAYDAGRRSRVRADSIFFLETAAETETGRAGSGADIEPLLQQLSADEREAIVLKIYNGLTFHQIAALRQVPVSTVASWHRRGLERLRTLLTVER